MTSRSAVRVVAACSAALFVPLLIPLATGRVFTLNDLAAMHLPYRFLYSEALRSGDSILWTSAVYSGFYLFGEGQVGMAHPWHFLLYRWLSLGVALNVEIIGSYIVMFAGTLLFLRRIGLSKEAGWFGAMVFTFSGYNLFHLMHVNVIAGVAHIPWLLLVSHAMLTGAGRKAQARAFAALALLFASQIFVSHTQHVWFGLLAVGALAVCLSWEKLAPSRIALLTGALLVGALMAGVQLLPLIDVADGSERTGWSVDRSLTYSLQPWNVVQLWSPFVFPTRVRTIPKESIEIHEFIVYNGAFCTLALSWLVVRWASLKRKRLVIALLVFAAVALLLAFGRYGGLYAWVAPLPGVRWFRASTRHLVLFHLALSVLAAIVFDDLVDLVRRREQIELRRLWPLAVPVALSVMTTALAAILVATYGYRLSGFAEAAPWFAILVLTAVLLVLAARGRRWALPILLAVVACDQGYWGFQYIFADLLPMRSVEALVALGKNPEEARPGDLFQPRMDYGIANLPVLSGFRVWPGYVGLIPASTLPTELPDLVSLRIAGAKWRRKGFLEFEPVENTADRARLLASARVSTNIAADVRTIDILKEALVDRPIEGLSGPPGSARVVEDRPGQIVVETTTPGPQLLVLTERFHAGWRVTDTRLDRPTDRDRSIDAHPVRAYGDFIGYVVTSGTHRLTFDFAPASFREGLWMSGVGAAVLLLVVLLAI